MTEKGLVTAATTVALLVALTVLWFRLDAQAPAPAVWSILFDPSDSQPRDCMAEASLARHAVAQMSDSGGTLRVLKIGDRSTANSPVLVMSAKVQPRISRVLREDTSDGGTGLSAEVLDKCETAARGQDSPVYIALRDAVDDASQRGAPDSTRQVLVRSDMRETVIKVIQRVLNQPYRSALADDLPPKIANERVTVFACGFAETRGAITRTQGGDPIILTRPRTADTADRLVEVWLALFTNPERVRIVPFCERAQMAN